MSIVFAFFSAETTAATCVNFEKSANSLKPSSTDTLKEIKLPSGE